MPGGGDYRVKRYAQKSPSVTTLGSNDFKAFDTLSRASSVHADVSSAEPSASSHALQRAMIVLRAKLQYGINDDPNQFAAEGDDSVQEQRHSERIRVRDWIEAVYKATAHRTPMFRPLPERTSSRPGVALTSPLSPSIGPTASPSAFAADCGGSPLRDATVASA